MLGILFSSCGLVCMLFSNAVVLYGYTMGGTGWMSDQCQHAQGTCQLHARPAPSTFLPYHCGRPLDREKKRRTSSCRSGSGPGRPPVQGRKWELRRGGETWKWVVGVCGCVGRWLSLSSKWCGFRRIWADIGSKSWGKKDGWVSRLQILAPIFPAKYQRNEISFTPYFSPYLG